MWKKLVFATVALALAGSTLVYAQQHRPGEQGSSWRRSAGDVSAFTDARIAALKAGLKLTPEQDGLWPAFEQATRDLAKLRAERREAWLNRERTWFSRDRAGSDKRADDPIDRLARRAEALNRNGAALKNLADAAAPLYRSLDEAQKQRFLVLARDIAPRHQRFALSDNDRRSEKSDRMDQGGEQLR